MSEKVKASDAVFGEWYELESYGRMRCVQPSNDDHGPGFIHRKKGWTELVFLHAYDIKHLPGCTGWDWEPPPEIDTSLAASIERYVDQHYNDHELDDDCSCIQCDRRRILEAARNWDLYVTGCEKMSLPTKPANDPDGVAALRERLGKRVRELWVAWAKRQQSVKPHWLIPWEELDEPMKEVDRCIGVGLWHDFMDEHREAIASHAMSCIESNDPDGVGEGWRLLKDGELIKDGDEYYHHYKQTWEPTECIGQRSYDGSRWQYRRRIDADRTKSVLDIAKETGMDTSGVKPQRDIVDVETGKRVCEDKPQPTEKRERREYYVWVDELAKDTRYIATISNKPNGGIHVREVLPGDDEREAWVGELAGYSELLARAYLGHVTAEATETAANKVIDHLAKRGE